MEIFVSVLVWILDDICIVAVRVLPWAAVFLLAWFLVSNQLWE